ncbi:Phosphatidylinositol-binding clathrin assembly protein [Liparis tanakae]|uniref:Phosphatidylinositol-binding clathrin assembly protein n=1 Tax=Liparis tanakae TaxID=230148 RepID=A0A4Z2E270_9TELE|nr:Phosphatidylinositol-binding clathrin assembly protein [Liparis tanakae]
MPAPHGAPLPPPQMAVHHGGKLLANDLDSSLANLVGSEPEMQWSQQGEKKLTGGQHWQNKTMSTTQWGPAPMAPPQPMPVQHVVRTLQTPSPLSPQVSGDQVDLMFTLIAKENHSQTGFKGPVRPMNPERRVFKYLQTPGGEE